MMCFSLCSVNSLRQSRVTSIPVRARTGLAGCRSLRDGPAPGASVTESWAGDAAAGHPRRRPARSRFNGLKTRKTNIDL
eukprot:266231-Hanusia_phi.AAC.1